jgi:hypothetical protein
MSGGDSPDEIANWTPAAASLPGVEKFTSYGSSSFSGSSRTPVSTTGT